MTDTSQAPEDEDTEDDEDELLPDLWVERSSSLIYEVRFLDTCVIVRPVTPSFYLAIRKLNHMEFARDFTEFCGDKDAVRDFVRKAPPDFIVG
jgi:hypothetical protein